MIGFLAILAVGFFLGMRHARDPGNVIARLLLRAVYFESNDAESEEVATMPIEARRGTQNLLLSDQDTKFARCRPIGVGHNGLLGNK
jgi:hypothetical protein